MASVRYPGTEESTGGRETAATVAAVLANHLRRWAPSVPVKASWGVAPTYLQAYADMRRRDVAELALICQPLVGCESPTTRPCDLCQSAPATHRSISLPVKQGSRHLCDDCHARVISPAFTERLSSNVPPTPGYSSAHDFTYLPRSQRDLHRSLGGGLTRPLGRFPADFSELAQVNMSADDAETHLACVYGDGNRVGAMLDAYASSILTPSNVVTRATGSSRQERRTVPKNEVVVRLDRATKNAVLSAAATVLPWRTQTVDGMVSAPPVIVHLADGDDILVSVPAPYGWPFVRALSNSFGAATTELAEIITPAGAEPIAPSLSVGLVFHHENEPFADVVARAGTMLKHAKRDVRGRCASVRFMDVTADGPAPIGHRTLTMAELDANQAKLDALARVSASQRATTLALLREVVASPNPAPADNVSASAQGASSQDQETATETLARRVLTMGISVIAEIVAGPDPTPEAVEQKLLHEPAARERLRTALDVARWWPAPAGKES